MCSKIKHILLTACCFTGAGLMTSCRLCKRGGFMESLVPELIAMPDEDAQTFFRLALTSEPAREFLRKRAEETTS